jgi:hypothetical protein
LKIFKKLTIVIFFTQMTFVKTPTVTFEDTANTPTLRINHDSLIVEVEGMKLAFHIQAILTMSLYATADESQCIGVTLIYE